MTLTEKEKLIAELAVKIWLTNLTDKKSAIESAAEFVRLAHENVSNC